MDENSVKTRKIQILKEMEGQCEHCKKSKLSLAYIFRKSLPGKEISLLWTGLFKRNSVIVYEDFYCIFCRNCNTVIMHIKDKTLLKQYWKAYPMSVGKFKNALEEPKEIEINGINYLPGQKSF